ncbi:MAG: class I SAM-dependent methyltransferase [Rhizobiales bacterium]|nr:class I SAM-dependent methyltransferase [Hyphomicrobiales bacterium]MBO6697414.1 class I SAM-dependent methyltransferase [Hyphomicrobiales bacterium]MBO6736331.1 class I SAM-dependent methyltransferase [Hyphomicrobiales bacterium]MBO6912801.1 class I SAM-dependent methyltransferase [Hyphomicrobiales bacterium]MBO6953969.1 class I SAM-dependent methyltransferase [Hyphomicrobiales bacterium]
MTLLHDLIRTEIETSGPITVGRYMQLCLSHPEHGYYVKGDPLGREGDFTTAPEISQLFGELIGAWLVEAWRQLGRPAPCALVELGPGRGTLMADILRIVSLEPALRDALDTHLVETSPALRAAQITTLAAVGVTPTHHGSLESVPNVPTLWVANEFFDALPTNQWVRTPKGWNARKIGLDDQGDLVFGVDPTPLPTLKSIADCPAGTIVEHSPAQDAVMRQLANHLHTNGGAGLIIDYGALKSGTGDTLQAVRNHRKTDSLADPGSADLTTHVDFEHLANIAQGSGLTTLGMADQGPFLLALGLLERAGQLGAHGDTATQNAISLAVERLAGDAAMGKLFKVMGFASAPISLPGLEPITTLKELA